ncbi:NADH-quinone oxidoreductase subunit N [Streptomyces sp. WMMC500]|uniref:NADH-quinone oxidoreductase subunit N n=1 Tax=Streptomyces sp. WMMC500 TaxID=3015154 RepID=UPI00248BB755|nr:NADH-quinone oxidoreductase subunit N [Streptomyces sp. WMMC500]WBB63833.1 NADH-quinone oxidoreductase subunit N [Streptomyces sp. WMMC500]
MTYAHAAAPLGAGSADTVLAESVVQSVDWLAVAPPTIVAVAAVALLVADLFVSERAKHLLGWGAVAALAVSLLALLPLLDGDRSTFCLTDDPNVCSYTADRFALVVQLVVLAGALLVALLSVHDVRATRLPAGEFWFLLLASAAGAALLPAARDLATLVIALEVASLPAFALVGLRRGDRLSSEAALKFFLSSVTATAVMLLGISFVYAAGGSLHLARLADGLASAPERLETLAAAGVVLTLVGFAFKTAAVPFHSWVPDTYVGAPVPVAAYLSVVGKAVGFSGLILVTVLAFPAYDHVWGPAIAVLAALTMTAGNVAALRQRLDAPHSAVRLLAWSSVAQAGYLLVPIAAAGYAEEPERAVGSTLSYALMYGVVNLGAFAVVAALAAKGGRGGRIADYRGLASTRLPVALALAFFLINLAGLPPGIIGLFAKVAVLGSAVDAGLGWLAVVMAANVVVGLYYYLKWTALLFRPAEPAAEGGPEGVQPVPTAPATPTAPVVAPPAAPLAAPLRGAIGLTAALGVALSGAPQLVLRFAGEALL